MGLIIWGEDDRLAALYGERDVTKALGAGDLAKARRDLARLTEAARRKVQGNLNRAQKKQLGS